MMQSIATSKTDIAAFATTGEQNASVALDSEFEQILQQQTNPQQAKPKSAYPLADMAKKTVEQQVKAEREQVESPAMTSALKNEITVKAEKPGETNIELATPDDSAINADSLNSQTADNVEFSAAEEPLIIKVDAEEVVFDDAQKVEDWLVLVEQLQALSTNEYAALNQQNKSADMPGRDKTLQADDLTAHSEITVESKQGNGSEVQSLLDTLANIQDFQVFLDKSGLTSSNELKQKLGELAATQGPEFAQLVTEMQAAPSMNKVMTYLANLEQKRPEVVSSEPAVALTQITALSAETVSFAQDVKQLLESKQLSLSEVKLLQQALHDSVNNKQPINTGLIDLVQAKLSLLAKSETASGSQSKLTQGRALTPLQTEELRNLLLNIAQSETSGSQKAQGLTQGESSGSVLMSKSPPGPLQSDAAKVNLVGEINDPERVFSPKVILSEQLDKPEPDKKPVLANTEKVEGNTTNSATLDKSAANKPVMDADMKALLALPKEKLDEALVNIAQRVAQLLADDAKVQQKSLDLSKVGIATVIPNTNSGNSNKEILAALKAGVSEFKEQLAAGREPGIDLKALVNNAITKTSDNEVSVQSTKNLDQALLGISQALNLAGELEESSHRQHLLRTIDGDFDKRLTQFEQLRTQSQSQTYLESKFDKALNLAKPEAHQQLADKVRWMVNTNNLIAEIRLDPAELGSVHVKVSLSADSASVNFVVQSQHTRDALESAAPRLREMLAEKGIELGQSTVRQDNQAKQDSQGQAQHQAKSHQGISPGNESFDQEEAGEMRQAMNHRQAAGGIDYFV